MVTNRIIFFATSVQPNPEEIDYWVDLSDNPYGGSIKYFNGTEWVRLAASGGIPDLSNYYTKTQVNKLLNDKANISDVDSKVDDEEVKDVIKDIQFNTSNPNDITMVMFKYDGSNKTVSIPVASTSSAGIITSKDFLDFVKQHQLQELHTEMIDTFADIRAKYQKKLIAGLNIEIDQETNVISASGDLAVQWDNITNKPDFKPVATSGDYNDLINKLKPGKDVSISEDNVISIAIDSDSLEQTLATLQSNIDKEAATARAAETKLGNDIATEKNRAQSAEQTISTNLQNEIDRSTQIDTQHTNAINKEVQDRKEAIDTEVSDRNAAILVETNRAKGAESANATAIANEVERATGVEETLNSNITQLQTQKVDKVEGKGLSTNDYTTPEKNKLAAIEAEANKYVLPAATTSALGGVKIGSNITLADGGTISITKANVTSALGVDPTTTYVKKAGDTMTGSLTIETTSDINLYSNVSVPSSRWAVVRLKSGDEFWDVTTKYGSGFRIQKQGQAITELVVDDSGNVTNTGYLKSKVATGTAPIQVSSTTLCTNLNADMVDGVNVKDIEHTLYISSTVKNYLKIQVNHKYFPNSYKIVEYYDGCIYVYQLLINAYSPEFTDLQLISGKVHTGIKTFYDLTKWYIETTESGMNIYIYQPENSNFKIYGVIHGEPQSPNVQFSVVSSLPSSVVSRHITFNVTSQNLEEFDWYGVSWSETSSNPDCTRIGNMDMHRSLPIQSMMKPFVITNYRHQSPENILPIDDNFSKSFYSTESNTQWEVVFSLDTDIMIRIPEFWYTDEYVPSSKTHNLKICPHAKPGWYHHKEAYVGAYELCETSPSSGKVCSAKGLIPLVGRTREVLRKAVRGNGFDGEAKWNLYTYEEHRAICHLFLVEYATRNSQKAVNTELTPEGFRQGGLGSGCTTGTATINGAQTWSFIPTGSSDSLGSGSGEVTVTIQQTDSSGSNTSTITRKCNRYRGIENPFGHIWKHTDDVISVYGNGHRTWYKSVKPNQFATNKNTSYKPFCASTMVSNGYKTEIKATPTCDFFATSVSGGSETTYWCDYNWDNTDTSEHCLLIGGRSDAGGLAGLFALSSADGVGASSATVGSRLTYLPWAE